MFTWSIENLERLVDTGQVVIAHWRVVMVENDQSAEAYGTVSFDPKDPSDPDFVPFEALTPSIVLGWVKAKLDVQDVEASLGAQLNARINPPIVAGTPW